jgi:hypothetical protein
MHMGRGRCAFTAGLRPGGRPNAGQQHRAHGTEPDSAIQKGFHVNFLKQTNTAPTHLGSGQTHLWREVQEMGGLVRGADMRARCIQDVLMGSGWA